MKELQHFHPKGKMPSKFTIELQKGLCATLRFEDKPDFEEAERGFVATPSCSQIMAEAGNVAWGPTNSCYKETTSTVFTPRYRVTRS
jgi:alkyl sulfatase BDS1-like metallo-beta-lactamase superfamily hydrolase